MAKKKTKEFDAQAEIEELKARVGLLERGQLPTKEKGSNEEEEKEE